MKSEILHKNFLNAIEEQIPKGLNIANVLMDILFIGKEAVYRRLRGEVPFTLQESVIIAQKLNISLDNTLGAISDKSRPFQLKLTEFSEPSEMDYLMMENFVGILQSIKKEPFSEFGSSENMLPLSLCYHYENLTRFYLFKWMYQYKGAESVTTFSEVKIPERLNKLQKDTEQAYKGIKDTYHIWDNMIFLYLVNDIKYFTSVRLISKEEVRKLKEDLLDLIDNIELLAARGHFDTGNKIHFYISNINLENTYSYIEFPGNTISLIRAFTLNAAASLDYHTFSKMKIWIQSLKRSSTLISETGEMQRIQFLKKQRELINSL